MKDNFGRTINYMRISVTDRCNLRCHYCMPNGIPWIPMVEILTYEEIEFICRQAVALGISRFKVTGGEPLVRLGCADFIARLKRISGVEQVTLTTNGVLLAEALPTLLEAGIDAVNISLDTLNRETYQKITGFDGLDAVLSSVEAALQSGIRVKLNTVLQQGVNDMEWEALVMLAKNRPLDVRFIEMMPIGHGKDFVPVSNIWLQERLLECYPGTKEEYMACRNDRETFPVRSAMQVREACPAFGKEQDTFPTRSAMQVRETCPACGNKQGKNAEPHMAIWEQKHMSNGNQLQAGANRKSHCGEKERGLHGNGPARYLDIPGFKGSIGFISALHGKFCDSCNRIRLTSAGKLKPCLCYADTVDVRDAARRGDAAEVRRLIVQAVERKPQMHCFEEQKEITEAQEMARIGG